MRDNIPREKYAVSRSARPGPAHQPNPLPDQARHAPLLRANHYSEVTDPICRLEALYLGDLLRIWVRTGATPPCGPLLNFQGPRGRSRHRRNCGALRIPNPISLLEVSRVLERERAGETVEKAPQEYQGPANKSQ